jgi:hypothetical protein
MARRITVVSAREMPYPQEVVAAATREVENIAITERKADWVKAHPRTSAEGTYSVRGHFAGVPWTGEFAYELHDAGFHSRTAGVPREAAKVEGGFVVTPLADGCTVFHYEQYVLARWLAPFALLVRAYLRWTMRGELRDLEALVADAAPSPSFASTMRTGAA